MAKQKAKDSHSWLGQIITAVAIALLAGGTSPWWWAWLTAPSPSGNQYPRQIDAATLKKDDVREYMGGRLTFKVHGFAPDEGGDDTKNQVILSVAGIDGARPNNYPHGFGPCRAIGNRSYRVVPDKINRDEVTVILYEDDKPCT